MAFPMHSLSKSFNLVYGHRLWNQTEPPCLCRNLHGHNAKITFHFAQTVLQNGMILDFNTLKQFKTQVLDFFDHQFFIDEADPLLQNWMEHYALHAQDVFEVGFGVKKIRESSHPIEKEFFSSFLIVPFHPTCEKLSQYFFELINQHGFRCFQCDVQEPDSGGASYHE